MTPLSRSVSQTVRGQSRRTCPFLFRYVTLPETELGPSPGTPASGGPFFCLTRREISSLAQHDLAHRPAADALDAG